MEERKIISRERTAQLMDMEKSTLALKIQLLEHEIYLLKDTKQKYEDIKSYWNSHETDEKDVIEYIDKILNNK